MDRLLQSRLLEWQRLAFAVKALGCPITPERGKATELDTICIKRQYDAYDRFGTTPP